MVTGPEYVQAVAFREDAPEDGHHAAHGVENCEKPDDSGHVGYGKSKAGIRDAWKYVSVPDRTSFTRDSLIITEFTPAFFA